MTNGSEVGRRWAEDGPERFSQSLINISIWNLTSGTIIERFLKFDNQKNILDLKWSMIGPYLARLVVRRGLLSLCSTYRSENRHQALSSNVFWNLIIKKIYWPSSGPLSALTWPEKWSGEVFSVPDQHINLKIDTRHYHRMFFWNLIIKKI